MSIPRRNTAIKVEGTAKFRLVTEIVQIVTEINGEHAELLNLDQLKISELNVIQKALNKGKEALKIVLAQSQTPVS